MARSTSSALPPRSAEMTSIILAPGSIRSARGRRAFSRLSMTVLIYRLSRFVRRPPHAVSRLSPFRQSRDHMNQKPPAEGRFWENVVRFSPSSTSLSADEKPEIQDHKESREGDQNRNLVGVELHRSLTLPRTRPRVNGFWG